MGECPRVKHLWYSDTLTVPIRIVRDWCVSCGEGAPVGDITEWKFSSHAVDRALDMALDADELRLALTRPDYVRPSPPTRPEYVGMKIHIRGRLAVAVNPSTKTVITVMWYEQFKSGDTRRRIDVLEDEEFFRDN